jgi:hypothetical protein
MYDKELMHRMNLLYKANEAETGLSAKFGKACLGLMLAWGLNYLYVPPRLAGRSLPGRRVCGN